MKTLITILFFITAMQLNTSAQNHLWLETATIGDATVITPALPNLLMLIKASKQSFVATVKKLKYVQSKPSNPNTYQTTSAGQIYNVDKEDKEIDIFFTDNTDYVKKVKDDFLAVYPGASHRSLDNGIEAYYFDEHEDGDTLHYCIFFDFPKDGGGGVTLLRIE